MKRDNSFVNAPRTEHEMIRKFESDAWSVLRNGRTMEQLVNYINKKFLDEPYHIVLCIVKKSRFSGEEETTEVCP